MRALNSARDRFESGRGWRHLRSRFASAWKDSSDLAIGEKNYKIMIIIIRTVCGGAGVQAAKNVTGDGYR
jgi:hypothetical protein